MKQVERVSEGVEGEAKERMALASALLDSDQLFSDDDRFNILQK